MITLALVASVLLAAVGTLALFTVPGTRLIGTPAGRAAAVAVAVGLSAIGLGAVLGHSPQTSVVAALLLGCAVLLWTGAARDWSAVGLLTWSMTTTAGGLYLAWVIRWLAGSSLTVMETVASVVLLLLEAFVLLLATGHVWELVDVLARRRWRRRLAPADPEPGAARPFVSLHVPTHNEPPEMVIATLTALLPSSTRTSRCCSSTTTPRTPSCGDRSRSSAPGTASPFAHLAGLARLQVRRPQLRAAE